MSDQNVSIDFSQPQGTSADQGGDPNWNVLSVAPAPDGAKQLATTYRTDEDSVGEWDDDDVRIPQLSLIHPMDERAIKRQFQAGDYVYHSMVALKQPFPIVAIKKRKRYIDVFDKDKEPKRRNRIVETAVEVRNLGGYIGFKDSCPPGVQLWGDMADVLVVFGQSTNDTGLFPFEFEGTFWCPAMYRAKSSAYTRFAVALETAKKTFLRDGIVNGGWTLESYLDTSGERPTFVPKLMWQKRNSPEFVEFLRGLTAGLV